MKVKQILLLITPLILVALQFHLFYDLLPERVSIHYTISGEPNGWADKSTAFLLEVGTLLFMDIMFWGITFLFKYFSDSAINIPHRHYWLAKERREETIVYLKDILISMGFMIQLFIVYLSQISYKVNLIPDGKFVFTQLLAMVVLFVIIGFMIIRMYKKFNNLPKED